MFIALPIAHFKGKGSAMEKGTVKWFNSAKGYGFIKRFNGEDIFVHHRAIRASGDALLSQGDSVQFEIKQGPKGPLASNVSRVVPGWPGAA